MEANTILKEVEDDLQKIRDELSILEDSAREIRELKTMPVSKAVIAVQKIDLTGFFLHGTHLYVSCSIANINLRLARGVSSEAETLEKITSLSKEVDSLGDRATIALSVREEMQKFYEDIAKEFEPKKQ